MINCKRCGTEFEKRRVNQAFCDPYCQMRYNHTKSQNRRRARRRAEQREQREQAQSNRPVVLHQPDDRANSGDRGVELKLPSGECY